MKQEEFRRSSYVLGKDHSIDILNLVYLKGWSKASDIANELDLHIATVSKYLVELKEIQLLESREAEGKTRMVVEYRIRDPKIELKFDISKKYDDMGELQQFYSDVYKSILDRTEKIYGIVPADVEDHEKNSTYSYSDMKENLRRLLGYNEEKLGLVTTQRLICSACKPIIDKRKGAPEGSELFKDLPIKYFEKLMEEL